MSPMTTSPTTKKMPVTRVQSLFFRLIFSFLVQEGLREGRPVFRPWGGGPVSGWEAGGWKAPGPQPEKVPSSVGRETPEAAQRPAALRRLPT